MRGLRLVVIFGVATLVSTVDEKFEPKISSKISSGVVTSIRQYFRSDCVYFITSANPRERLYVVSTQRTLGQQRSIFTKVLPYQTLHLVASQLRSFCNIPIYVMFSDNDDLKDFLMTAASKIKLAGSVWLLLMVSNTTMDDQFKDAYIPFDTEFIVGSLRSEDVVSLTEVYRVLKGGPLLKYAFSTFTMGKGMTPPVEGLYQRRDSLEGMVMTGADVHYPPVSELNTTKDNVTHLGGFSGEVWNILETELNFKTVHKIPAEGVYGIPVNKTINNVTSLTWDGMVAMLLKEEAHVTSTATTMTSERSLAVSFSLPIFTSSFLIYMRKPDKKAVNWTDWAAPFSGRLWAAFVFQTIVSAFLMVGVSWMVRRFGSENDEGKFKVNDQLFLTYGAIICQQGQEEKTPFSWSCRIMFFVTYITGVILAASYSGSIISNLTVLRLHLPFHDLEGLLKNGEYNLGMLHVSFIYEIFRTAEKGLFYDLYKKHIMNDPANLIADNFQGFKRVCDKDFAFISNPEAASLWRDKLNCSIVSLPQVFVEYTNCFMLPKNSPYLDLFNNKLLKLINDGVLRKIYRKFMFKEEPEVPNMFNSIVLEDVTPMLVIVVGGMAVGWLLVGVEHALKRTLEKHPLPDMATLMSMTKEGLKNRKLRLGEVKRGVMQRRQGKKVLGGAGGLRYRSFLPRRFR